MKKNFSIVIASFIGFALSVTIFVSCKKTDLVLNNTVKDLCDSIVCYNGGACISGVCKCPVGFEGVDCLKRWNETYPGTYTTQDICNTNPYTVNITAVVGDPTKISFDQLGSWCAGHSYIGNLVTNNTTIVLPMQRVCNDIYVNGTGTQGVDNDIINLNLTARDSINHSSSYCTISLKKK
jgi:hypothetical protein